MSEESKMPSPNNEKEIEKFAVKKLLSKINELNIDVDLLCDSEKESEWELFSKDERAGIFNKPSMTIKEYFDHELKNLGAGLSLITESEEKSKIIESCNILSVKISRAIDPENFTLYSLSLIEDVLTHTDKLIQKHLRVQEIHIYIQQLGHMVKVFNSYIKERHVEITKEMKAEIDIINQGLKYHRLPSIEV